MRVPTPREVLRWSAGVLVGIILAVYIGDFVWFEIRMWRRTPTQPLETITFFLATPTKNGKIEVFYDQPQTATCAHSLFPHAGAKPCWYVERSAVKMITRAIPYPELRPTKREKPQGHSHNT